MEMFIEQANTNAQYLRILSKEYGPGDLAAAVQATGEIAGGEVGSVADALGAAGYTNTALLADLDATELRQELRE